MPGWPWPAVDLFEVLRPRPAWPVGAAAYPLALVQGDGVPPPRLVGAEARALMTARDPVDQRRHAARLGVRLIESGFQQRLHQRDLVDVHSLGDARELRRALVVEGDMERAWDARDRR